jgi:hypothetical protein
MQKKKGHPTFILNPSHNNILDIMYAIYCSNFKIEIFYDEGGYK